MFEVNSSSKRSGKHILSQLEEATQSHLVINNKGPTPQSSFAGLVNKPVNNSSPASGPLGAFFNANANASYTKAKKGEKREKQQKMKEKRKDESKGKGRSILKQPPQAVNDDTESCSSLSSKAASLILFEEVCTVVLNQSTSTHDFREHIAHHYSYILLLRPMFKEQLIKYIPLTPSIYILKGKNQRSVTYSMGQDVCLTFQVTWSSFK